MNKYTILLLLTVLSIGGLFANPKKGDNVSMQKIDVMNLGTLAFPISLEERSDIPFKMLVDEEFRKVLGDTVDYEKFRPALIFFEKGFQAPALGDKKKNFAYISVAVLSGQYRFPKQLSDEQKETIEKNTKEIVEDNIKNTQFSIKKWNPMQFERINGLVATTYSYEQVQNGKDQMNIVVTSLYDSDTQIEFIMSAPKKDYKKWLTYYNSMLKTFNRSINISDIATLEYPTTVKDHKHIPFKYLVDKEFRKILSDSLDYEKLRPNLLLLDRDFAINDTNNVAPFGSVSINLVPSYNKTAPRKEIMNLGQIEAGIKNDIQSNLEPTAYEITKWGDFELSEIHGLPIIKYSYTQTMDGREPSLVNTSYILEKDMQIQITASAPIGEKEKWNYVYDKILDSYHRYILIPNRGKMLYPENLDERSDIPFVKLVDRESKRKLGDSIDYEKFRPTKLFLKKGFNENDSLQLLDFGSIVLIDTNGDFSRLYSLNMVSSDTIETEMKETVQRNLQNTNYKLVSWDSFNDITKSDCRIISLAYSQQIDGEEPKRIVQTYIYTKSSQTQIILTSSANEYSLWKPEYDRIINSLKLFSGR